ncbi:EndoU domain-containing protein [Frankia sp. CNm7]|uniref:EndoU domain-containing protein n=1 Tax=Frankia nepalensis TaxID=1836974 RepID=A0A937R5S4_9ACTN|nr:EndoU domain-containing protein [Frankia nepalensis]MBL7498713.1 EndoU domain-containing protein [Frankia nepalensis]MBL7508422.1 EndoU domain-containing protein [Frankia nepalensis]MBL7522440.1 EndoU domain-containing protein [Frankia nepalensis]MBL7626253.1 EndoU domain-containing protein [Frankia nepalensis]
MAEIDLGDQVLTDPETGRTEPHAVADLIADLHMYYVPAGQTPVLVHNSNGNRGIGRELIGDEGSDHILDGHRYPGMAGKDAFPKGWSDDQILDAVADVVTSPNSRRIWYKGSAVWADRTLKARKGEPVVQNVIGTVGGVRILVRYEPLTGKVLTAFPHCGNISIDPGVASSMIGGSWREIRV